MSELLHTMRSSKDFLTKQRLPGRTCASGRWGQGSGANVCVRRDGKLCRLGSDRYYRQHLSAKKERMYKTAHDSPFSSLSSAPTGEMGPNSAQLRRGLGPTTQKVHLAKPSLPLTGGHTHPGEACVPTA